MSIVVLDHYSESWCDSGEKNKMIWVEIRIGDQIPDALITDRVDQRFFVI